MVPSPESFYDMLILDLEWLACSQLICTVFIYILQGNKKKIHKRWLNTCANAEMHFMPLWLVACMPLWLEQRTL